VSRVRSFAGVKNQALREKVDVITNELHDLLEDAYYGTYVSDGVRMSDGWKHGVSKPFLSWDVEPTLPESLALFQALHGMLFQIHTLMFHEVNLKEPEPLSSSAYDDDLDENQNPVSKVLVIGQQLLQTALETGVNPIPMKNWIKSEVQTQLGHNINL